MRVWGPTTAGGDARVSQCIKSPPPPHPRRVRPKNYMPATSVTGMGKRSFVINDRQASETEVVCTSGGERTRRAQASPDTGFRTPVHWDAVRASVQLSRVPLTLDAIARCVSAGSGVLQGECVPGPGVLKRRVRGYLQLQGHKEFRLQALGKECATREPTTVLTPAFREIRSAGTRFFQPFSERGQRPSDFVRGPCPASSQKLPHPARAVPESSSPLFSLDPLGGAARPRARASRP
jgi:hypothetical protein